MEDFILRMRELRMLKVLLTLMLMEITRINGEAAGLLYLLLMISSHLKQISALLGSQYAVLTFKKIKFLEEQAGIFISSPQQLGAVLRNSTFQLAYKPREDVLKV